MPREERIADRAREQHEVKAEQRQQQQAPRERRDEIGHDEGQTKICCVQAKTTFLEDASILAGCRRKNKSEVRGPGLAKRLCM